MLEQAEGTLQNIAGRIQDAVGGATGDTSTQLEGKRRQLAGKAQQSYGQVLDTIRESAVTNPIATVAGALSIGFVLGALLGSRR